MSVSLRVGALACVLLAVSCRKSPEAEVAVPTDEHRDEEAHDALPDKVTASPEVVASSGIRTTKVRRAPLPVTLTLTGELLAEPDRTARISSTVAGRLEEVRFNEGSVVKRGDVLALVRVPDVGRLRGALAAATSRARAARANADRLQPLKESRLESEQAVLNAEADAHAQEAEAKALVEQLSAMGADNGTGFVVSLRAPISGVVVARNAVAGQPIATDTVLGSIVDLSELWFLARVFEKDLARLHTGAAAEVEFNAYPTEHFHGTVDYVSQQLDPVARTLTARIRLQNEGTKLRLGLFGRAHVDVAEEHPSAPQLLIPRDAVFDIDGKRVVFVKAADGDFVLHTVTLGAAAMDDVQVLAGISEGEDVVSSGGFTLKSLLLKSSLSEDE